MPYRSLLTLCLLALCGCSNPRSALHTVEPPQAVLPAVAALDAQHAASVVTESTQDGADAVERSPGALVVGTTLALAPAVSDMEWAIWGFDTGGGTPVELEVELSNPIGPGGWIGVADYGSGHWTFHGEHDATATIVLPGSGQLSPGGYFYCAVVTPSGQAVVVDSVTLSVDDTPPAEPLEVDPDGPADAVRDTSMQLVNGRPAIAYVDYTNQTVRYVRALDPAGSAWGDSILLAAFGSTGGDDSASPHLLVVNGRPAVAYFSGDFKLGYVRALDADGAAWGLPQTVDNDEETGDYPKMAIVEGNPAIAYYSFGTDAVRYVRASDADGTLWGTPVEPATPLGMTDETKNSMALTLVGGHPAIAFMYHDPEEGTLGYVRAGDTSGATWGTPVDVDLTPGSGYFADLKVLGGVPVIAYCSLTDAQLKMAHAEDADGTAWGTPAVLEDGGAGGTLTLTLIDDLPAIQHYDFIGKRLLHMTASDVAGTAWPATSQVLDLDTGAYGSMIQLPGGGAGISYCDEVDGPLLYMQVQ
jgi:hypothetical protein